MADEFVNAALFDDRLRAVEGSVIELTGEIKEARRDISDFVKKQEVSPRRETCPHNDDFVRILAALDAGSKRFGTIERTLYGVGDETGLVKRVEAIEKLITWLKGARWAFVGVGVFIGWLIGLISPWLLKVIEH